jgi:hypothetical protein
MHLLYLICTTQSSTQLHAHQHSWIVICISSERSETVNALSFQVDNNDSSRSAKEQWNLPEILTSMAQLIELLRRRYRSHPLRLTIDPVNADETSQRLIPGSSLWPAES